MRALIRNVVLPVHRWTALTVGLVVLWMALTGLGLLFKAQLEPVVNRRLETVAPCPAPQPLDGLVARARVAHPDGALRLVGIEGSSTRSTWVRFANGDTVYLDPCSGRTVGELNKYRGVFGALEYLHRLEFLSEADHAAAGTVALVFALVIVIGGIAIWWPVSLKGLRWSVTFALRPAGRPRLMRMHRATGFWVCLLVLCSALTGPIDSFPWYQRAIAFLTDSARSGPEPAPIAAAQGRQRLTLQALWQRAQAVTPDPQEALLLIPKTPASPVELDIVERSAPNHQAVSFLYLDPYTGHVLGFEPYGASSLANKTMAWGIAIHSGQAGVPAQMALLVGSLGIIVLGYTGLSSYMRRRAAAGRDRAGARPHVFTSICCLAVLLGGMRVARADDLPTYRPQARVSGTIRVWGSPDDGWLIEELEAGFRKHQPAVRFEDTLHGPESTFAAVYMDVADVAFMAREIRVPLETMGFEWVHHYPPFEVAIANAGLGAGHNASRPATNLAFFVNRRNPLACVTLRQLDDIFAADHRRGGDNVRRWGGVGIGGDWARRAIHVYGPAPDNTSSVFVRRSVLGGSRKWNPGYRTVAGGWSEVLESVARDPDGIAFAPPRPGNLRTKALRLAVSRQSPCYPLTAQSAAARTYPLLRTVDVALDRAPGAPMEPKVKEFLRFILSSEGQRIVVTDGAYLPLSGASVHEQLGRLQ